MYIHSAYYYSYLDYFLLACVFANSIALANIDLREEWLNSTRNHIINYLNLAFTFVYIAEAIIKIIAQGLVMREHTYLRDYLNYLDLTIIVGG